MALSRKLFRETVLLRTNPVFTDNFYGFFRKTIFASACNHGSSSNDLWQGCLYRLPVSWFRIWIRKELNIFSNPTPASKLEFTEYCRYNLMLRGVIHIQNVFGFCKQTKYFLMNNNSVSKTFIFRAGLVLPIRPDRETASILSLVTKP
jgi:hypothetical protein